MGSTLVRELIDAGIHFGHRSSRWNPKMKPYIFGKRNLIHVIDIRETVRGLLRARKFVTKVVSAGQDVLLVGTKRQARDAVKAHADRCGMHYVNERWLGGTLTNFRTIRSRLQRLEELEALANGPNFGTFSKKMQSTMQRELKKIQRNLDGIRRMQRLPGAVVVVDVRKEANAVREAKALGIPTVALIDTDGDPDFASIAIPGNDDAIRAIDIVLRHLADAVEEGKRARPEPSHEAADRDQGEAKDGMAAPRRRGRRMPAPARVGAGDGGAFQPAEILEPAEAAPPEPVLAGTPHLSASDPPPAAHV